MPSSLESHFPDSRHRSVSGDPSALPTLGARAAERWASLHSRGEQPRAESGLQSVVRPLPTSCVGAARPPTIPPSSPPAASSQAAVCGTEAYISLGRVNHNMKPNVHTLLSCNSRHRNMSKPNNYFVGECKLTPRNVECTRAWGRI